MTSSSAISYPTLEGLESSNSSFVKVSQPIRYVNSRNLPSNHRHSSSKAERGGTNKHKPLTRPTDHPEMIDDLFVSRRQQKDCLGIRDVVTNNERSSTDGKTTIDDPKLKVEKSQQYDIRESGVFKNIRSVDDEVYIRSISRFMFESFTSCNVRQKASNADEVTDLSCLVKPDSVQSLMHKFPKHTFIINNTYINRTLTEQDEFLAKLSPNFFAKCPNDKTLVVEHEPHIKEPIDTVCKNLALEHINDEKLSTAVDTGAPIGSIVTGVLWIVLILFWFLLYMKVLSVYSPLPKIPPPEPSNFELFLMFFRKFGIFIGKLWKF